MKRQTQVAGVRRWFADDLLELQSETFKAIDAIVGAYKTPFVISGCEKQPDGSVSAGYVALGIKGEEGLKIMPFEGYSRSGVFYMLARKRPVNSVYADGESRLAAYQYEAWGAQTLPPYTPEEMPPYIQVSPSGFALRLTDVMQDADHRFVSDLDKNKWNAAKQGAIDSANSYTRAIEGGLNNSIALRPLKEETVTLYPDTSADPTPGHDAPDSDENKIFYCSNANKDTKGLYVMFSKGTKALAIQAQPGENDDFFIAKKIYTSTPAAGHRPYYWIKEKLLHTGNGLPIISAGTVSVDGSNYNFSTGIELISKKQSATSYRLSHSSLSETGYTVVVTPLGTMNRSFAVFKDTTYFDVKFDAPTEFDVLVLKHKY